MKASELAVLLNQYGDEEVKIRVEIPSALMDDGISADEIDGSYLNITDDRSVLFENDAVVIIGDLPDE